MHKHKKKIKKQPSQVHGNAVIENTWLYYSLTELGMNSSNPTQRYYSAAASTKPCVEQVANRLK